MRSTVVEVARLILVNGPPASGKSTIAARFVSGHRLALNLDVDVVRGMLGAWIEMPSDAGVAARRLAIAMTAAHLAGGHDVVVPQFLARVDFILELEAVARAAGAQFVETALIVSRADTLRAFVARSAEPETQQHRDANEILERTGGIDALGAMHDRFMGLLDTRPSVHRVRVVRGDVESTLRLLESAIETAL